MLGRTHSGRSEKPYQRQHHGGEQTDHRAGASPCGRRAPRLGLLARRYASWPLLVEAAPIRHRSAQQVSSHSLL